MKRCLLLLLIVAVTLTSSCNLALAPSTVAHSVSESKQGGFFKGEYMVDTLRIFDKHKPFIVQSAWVEKSHTSTFDFWGKETNHTSNTSFQIVFKMAENSYFKNEDFLNTWTMYYKKEVPCGLDGEMITIHLLGKSIPDSINFYAFKLKSPGSNSPLTDTIAEFTLKKL